MLPSPRPCGGEGSGVGGRHKCLAQSIGAFRARETFARIRLMPNASFGSICENYRLAHHISDGKQQSDPSSRTLPVTPIES